MSGKFTGPLPPPVFHSLHRIEDLSTAEQKPGKLGGWGTRETALGLPTTLSLSARGQDSWETLGPGGPPRRGRALLFPHFPSQSLVSEAPGMSVSLSLPRPPTKGPVNHRRLWRGKRHRGPKPGSGHRLWPWLSAVPCCPPPSRRPYCSRRWSASPKRTCVNMNVQNSVRSGLLVRLQTRSLASLLPVSQSDPRHPKEPEKLLMSDRLLSPAAKEGEANLQSWQLWGKLHFPTGKISE